jgi:hypothetical protein
LWVHSHLDGLTEEQCLAGGVCGVWSVKEIIAHLASFEWLLVEVLRNCVEPGLTPTLNLFTSMDGDSFNAVQVDLRKEKTAAEVVREYDEAADKVLDLVPRIEAGLLGQTGTIPWYGAEYSIEDLVVYQYYGHKREHMAQVAMYRDRLRDEGKL